MKTKSKSFLFFLIISLSIIQISIGQSIFQYDKKYYDGYVITSDNPSNKKVVPNTKIECKIKNMNYDYFSSDQTAGSSYVEYLLKDGSKDKLWWQNVAEIKTDSFYYKQFGFNFINYEYVLARNGCEGKINYWINRRIDFFEINDSIIRLSFGDGTFMVAWNNSRKKVDESILKYKVFMSDLVKDNTDLVAKINSEDYLDFSNYEGCVNRNTIKIIKEYNEWYKKNH